MDGDGAVELQLVLVKVNLKMILFVDDQIQVCWGSKVASEARLYRGWPRAGKVHGKITRQ
jgi:hypothetical protein